MYGRVLVTLDGSKLSEAVLPFVARFSLRAGTEQISLFSVVERAEGNELSMAEGYLSARAGELEDFWREQGAISPDIRCVVVSGMASQAPSKILDFAEESDIDLIAMASHGRSGIDRWIIGSVAEKVARGADIPVLVVRCIQRPLATGTGLRRMLVPLDGSAFAERALPFVGRLAAFGGGKVTILHVRSRSERASRLKRKAARGKAVPGKDLQKYLESVVWGLGQSGVQAEARIREGDAGEEIAKEAEEEAVDLIIMSSHGRGRLARWAYGSVADKLLHGTSVPILLTRATASGDAPEHLQGPLVHRCHNCARIVHTETFTSEDRCPRCRQLLRACGNCVQHEGVSCILRVPDATQLYPGNRCDRFQFRKTRLALR